MEISVKLLTKKQGAWSNNILEPTDWYFAIRFRNEVNFLKLEIIIRVKILVEKIRRVSFQFMEGLVLMLCLGFLFIQKFKS